MWAFWWRNCADDGARQHALRQLVRTNQCMRSSSGVTFYIKATNPEVVSQLADILRPIQEPTIWLRVRNAMPRPVGRYEPDSQIQEDRFIHWVLQARAAGTAKMEDCLALWVTIFGIP